MPLLKRKPFPLVEPPQDLDPHELIFQVRFTKEIFRDYQEYLKRINLYRQRVWTCKVTGKTNLTYEEALVSEQRASEKVQQFPKELMAPVLHMIQFSTLRLKDLVNTISMKLQERLIEGVELYGRKEKCVCPCKILKVLEEDVHKVHYEVGWLDKYKKVISNSVVNADDLIRKKLPFTRNVLKSFIRESTSRSTPWVVHDKLARKHGVSTEPPEELQDKLSIQDACLGSNKQRKKNKEDGKNISDAKKGETSKNKREKLETENSDGLIMRKKPRKEHEKSVEEPIKYPIDDLLVKPGADDPTFTVRPSPSRDFGVPMDCVGDLLMVWDFCSSFSRLLHLWPFSLEDFENAICHKNSNLILIVESHSALLRLLIKDEGKYFMAIQNKKRKPKITLMNWTEYLCDFLEMEDIPELSTVIGTIKRGHYGLLDSHAKLGIFRELVAQALETDTVREQLDKYIEQKQELAATKRGEALEDARKRREEKELKAASDTKDVIQGHGLENGGGNLHISENGYNNGPVGDVSEERDEKAGNHASESKESNSLNTASRKIMKKQKMNVKVNAEIVKEPSRMEERRKALKQRKNKQKKAQEKKSKEQRKEHLEREIEKRFIRTNSLGKDRNHNRYWFFRHDGRIFVESSDSKLWGYYSVKEELDALIGSLNCKGERERSLQIQLEKYYDRICSALQKRSRDIAQRIALEEAVLRRSTRVRAPPRDNPALAFLRYVNKWKED